ncbi:MAG: hypothetical protein LUC44_02270, partial [Prevotellaceae bacterium]|nr:hypothetical protein [Prevotellaceae bacterium]
MEDLEEQVDEIQQQEGYTAADLADDTLVTCSMVDERLLDQDVYMRKTEVLNYPEHLGSLLREIDLKVASGLFGTEGSFQVRSLEYGRQMYAALEDVDVTAEFSGGIEVLTGWKTYQGMTYDGTELTESWSETGAWRMTDLLFLFFALAGGLVLMTQERQDGMFLLLRPMKRSRAHLFLIRYAAMTVLVLVGWLLTYGADLLISGCTLGFGDLSRSIQSVYGMEDVPYAWSVGRYLVY